MGGSVDLDLLASLSIAASILVLLVMFSEDLRHHVHSNTAHRVLRVIQPIARLLVVIVMTVICVLVLSLRNAPAVPDRLGEVARNQQQLLNELRIIRSELAATRSGASDAAAIQRDAEISAEILAELRALRAARPVAPAPNSIVTDPSTIFVALAIILVGFFLYYNGVSRLIGSRTLSPRNTSGPDDQG